MTTVCERSLLMRGRQAEWVGGSVKQKQLKSSWILSTPNFSKYLGLDEDSKLCEPGAVLLDFLI